jgi:hypothetical protein
MSIPTTRSLAVAVGIVVAIATTSSAASGGLLAAPAATPNPVFEGITPVRVFDTRDGRGGHPGPLGPGETATFTIAGTNGIPVDATAITINVTALNATEQTHLTVWPAGAERPEASNLNPASALPEPNLVTVKVGDGGAISVFNNTGRVDVFGDIVGYHRDHDHDHDDRYPTRAEVDAALASQSASISVLQSEVSTLHATVPSLAGAPSAAGSLLDIDEVIQTRSVPLSLTASGQRRPIDPNSGLVIHLETDATAGAVRLHLRAYVGCTHNPGTDTQPLDVKIAPTINGVEGPAITKTGAGDFEDFDWTIPVTGTGGFSIAFVAWADTTGGGLNASCLVDGGQMKARLVR